MDKTNDYRRKKRRICPEHGEYWLSDFDIELKKGCPKCSLKKSKKINTKSFLEFILPIMGLSYGYKGIPEYCNGDDKITLICKEHGEFEITPQKLLSGQVCPTCMHNAHLQEKSISQSGVVCEKQKNNVIMEQEKQKQEKENQEFSKEFKEEFKNILKEKYKPVYDKISLVEKDEILQKQILNLKDTYANTMIKKKKYIPMLFSSIGDDNIFCITLSEDTYVKSFFKKCGSKLREFKLIGNIKDYTTMVLPDIVVEFSKNDWGAWVENDNFNLYENFAYICRNLVPHYNCNYDYRDVCLCNGKLKNIFNGKIISPIRELNNNDVKKDFYFYVTGCDDNKKLYNISKKLQNKTAKEFYQKLLDTLYNRDIYDLCAINLGLDL